MKRAPAIAARRGLTLLEVIVALTIFLIALIGVSQLINKAADTAQDVTLQGAAIRLCQSKMNEIVWGAVPLEDQEEVPFEEDSDWHWTLKTSQGDVTNLWVVELTVSRTADSGKRTEASLHQMILDPSQRGSTFDTPASSSTSNSDSSASSSASSATGSTGSASSGSGGSSGGSATSKPSTTPTTTPKPSTTPTTTPKPSTTPTTTPKPSTTPTTTPKPSTTPTTTPTTTPKPTTTPTTKP